MNETAELPLRYVSELNDTVGKGGFRDLVNRCEQIHSDRISRIAELVATRVPAVRLVLLAGPSAAGKTTSAIRLCRALSKNGIPAMHISTDNYFVGNARNPRDENGELDYEHFGAIDRERLAADLNRIFAGEPLHLRKFDFVKHEGFDDSGVFDPPQNAVVVLEGIHALNPALAEGVDDGIKYRVYVNTLTQLVADTGGWLYFEDARLMRRIVRDKTYRDMSPETTISMWGKVSAGETKWINPYRGFADSVFNTALAYELAVMKPVLEPVLKAVPYLGGRENAELRRLLAVLETVSGVSDHDAVPPYSILRESIGGSEFEYA